MTDGKLVRDHIPDLIRANGEAPITYVAAPAEYRQRLRDKLLEEVDEFLTADSTTAVEELADVLEVVYALAADLAAGTVGGLVGVEVRSWPLLSLGWSHDYEGADRDW